VTDVTNYARPGANGWDGLFVWAFDDLGEKRYTIYVNGDMCAHGDKVIFLAK
jgi:hypothetical protein